MRRFLYDALLLVIIVLIGLSISDYDNVNVDKQKELERFEEKIKTEKVVNNIEKKVTLNQIEENGAAYIAKNTSSFLKDFVDVSVKTVSNIFKMIIE